MADTDEALAWLQGSAIPPAYKQVLAQLVLADESYDDVLQLINAALDPYSKNVHNEDGDENDIVAELCNIAQEYQQELLVGAGAIGGGFGGGFGGGGDFGGGGSLFAPCAHPGSVPMHPGFDAYGPPTGFGSAAPLDFGAPAADAAAGGAAKAAAPLTEDAEEDSVGTELALALAASRKLASDTGGLDVKQIQVLLLLLLLL